METHTLARYISESMLQEYSFVTECPSYIAVASMYLALRMKKLGPWVSVEGERERGRWWYYSMFALLPSYVTVDVHELE